MLAGGGTVPTPVIPDDKLNTSGVALLWGIQKMEGDDERDYCNRLDDASSRLLSRREVHYVRGRINPGDPLGIATPRSEAAAFPFWSWCSFPVPQGLRTVRASSPEENIHPFTGRSLRRYLRRGPRLPAIFHWH